MMGRDVWIPTAEDILLWATDVADDWRWLAMLWHFALAAAVIALVSGWRPSRRLFASVLVLPLISVGVLAWVSGNPFNGLAFAALATALVAAAVQLPQTPVTRGSPGWVVAGSALVAFGWAYPHFLTTDTWTAYMYASPFGLLPCPTLSVVIGATLISGGLHSARWSVPLAAAGLIYGVIGVFKLGVALDLWLLAGAVLLFTIAVVNLVVGRVRATDDERTRALPARWAIDDGRNRALLSSGAGQAPARRRRS